METQREFLQETIAVGIASIVASGVAPAFAKERIAKGGVTLEEAWKVHCKCHIIDGHNDTLIERAYRKENPINLMKRDPSYQTDLPRMKESGQQYTAFMNIEDNRVTDVWVSIEQVVESIDLNPKDIMLVLSSKDAVRAGKSGKGGVIFSIEGAGPILGGKIEILHILYRLGVRQVNIGTGGQKYPNNFHGSPSFTRLCTPEDREAERKNAVGLTPFGLEVLKTCNEMGIVADAVHINDKAFYDVMEHSTRPPIASHTAVFALCQHSRCLTDDQIKALAARGGVMGIVLLPGYIDTDPKKATVDRIVDHILYVADLVGIDTVGFGSDYDGFSGIPIVPDVSQLVNLTRAMLARGLTVEEIKKFWGGNFLRVIQKNIDKPGK